MEQKSSLAKNFFGSLRLTKRESANSSSASGGLVRHALSTGFVRRRTETKFFEKRQTNARTHDIAKNSIGGCRATGGVGSAAGALGATAFWLQLFRRKKVEKEKIGWGKKRIDYFAKSPLIYPAPSIPSMLSPMNLPKLSLLVLDTETTGFVPKVHHVMEFACVRFLDGKVTDEVEQLLSLPGGNEIPPSIQMLTRITPADLEGKPTFEALLPSLVSLIESDTIIVGQNVQFDLGMLRGEGWDLTEQPWIDTSMLASLVFPELHSYSLGYMSDALKLDHTPRHRALGDVRATAQLLEKCVERILSLPESDLTKLRTIAERGPRGYAQFFAALGPSKAKKRPSWLQENPRASESLPAPRKIDSLAPGTTQLIEEPLSPSFLQGVLLGASGTTWVSVKNVEAAVRRFEIPKETTVLYPPEFLFDEVKCASLAQASHFTGDEMTILIKAYLYAPVLRTDLPIHGGEYQVWSGKIAATKESVVYKKLETAAVTGPVVLSHQYLLSLLQREEISLPKECHLLIDDASMLEDTATNAFAWTCHLPTLRAASQGAKVLMQCTDVIELWSEKIRNGLDLRYIAPSDLDTRESLELRKLLVELRTEMLPESVRMAIQHLLLILDPTNLPGRITWIEAYQDGSKTIKSVPEDIAKLLKNSLFSRAHVTLLVPPYSATNLSAILSNDVSVEPVRISSDPPPISVLLPMNENIESVLKGRTGKTVILVSSKRTIEDVFVKHSATMEAEGVTLLCQGFSGGQGRMQAEFELAKEPAFMVMTPWMYEGMELPAHTVDRLILQVMPFDHPNHAVVSRRALRYRDPFSQYSLPRLKHRLFRLLRTFSKHAKVGAEALVLDDRLRTKAYGKEVTQYLLALGQKRATEQKAEKTEAPLQKEKKSSESQLPLL